MPSYQVKITRTYTIEADKPSAAVEAVVRFDEARVLDADSVEVDGVFDEDGEEAYDDDEEEAIDA